MKRDKVFIIAEAGVNHNGDIKLALQMVDEAGWAKADAIKFQVYNAKKIVTCDLAMADYQKKNIAKRISQLEMLKQYELKKKELKQLIKYAEERKILLLATPFDQESVDMLVELKRPYLKVDSASIINHPFLEYISKSGIPLIVSTGAATMQEVREAVAVIERHNRNLTLLHCTAMYPAPYQRVNLLAMKEMMREFDYPIGYSDHTLGIEVSIAAVALGAKVIEKHFTLSRSMEGPDQKASLEPDELANMVVAIRHIEQALGKSDKAPCEEEIQIMKTGRSSIIAALDLKKGQALKRDDIVIKRPGTGIQPKYLKDILGKKLISDVAKDTPLQYSDIEEY